MGGAFKQAAAVGAQMQQERWQADSKERREVEVTAKRSS